MHLLQSLQDKTHILTCVRWIPVSRCVAVCHRQPLLQLGLVQPPSYLSPVWTLHTHNVNLKQHWCVIFGFLEILLIPLKCIEVSVNVRKYYDNVAQAELSQRQKRFYFKWMFTWHMWDFLYMYGHDSPGGIFLFQYLKVCDKETKIRHFSKWFSTMRSIVMFV